MDITFNNALTNLNGLSGLTSVGGDLWFTSNTVLNEFCGLYTLLSSNGLVGSYNISGNGVNPTQQQIIDGGLCITVYVGDLILTNQAEVDAFHYSSVTGYLDIDDGSAGDISNLNSLLELTSVGGDLYLANNHQLTNIDGLSNLSSVGNYLFIQSNAALTNIDGLSNLTSVGGALFIYDHGVLTNIDGLSNS